MEDFPECPACGSEYTYENRSMFVCSECSNEWSKNDVESEEIDEGLVVRDAQGSLLKDGDSVTVVKDIKVKGSPVPIKMGIKIKNIRLIEPVNGHNIDVKVKGFGALLLKSELVKKSN